MPDVDALKALGNERRLMILNWLKDPRAHFREQIDGDLVEDGVCALLIAEKLDISQPTLSEHMRVLVGAGRADRALGRVEQRRCGALEQGGRVAQASRAGSRRTP